MIDHFMHAYNWHVADRLRIPSREGGYFTSDDLSLSLESLRFLANSFPMGIYLHQKETFEPFSAQDPVIQFDTSNDLYEYRMSFYQNLVRTLSGGN